MDLGRRRSAGLSTSRPGCNSDAFRISETGSATNGESSTVLLRRRSKLTGAVAIVCDVVVAGRGVGAFVASRVKIAIADRHVEASICTLCDFDFVLCRRVPGVVANALAMFIQVVLEWCGLPALAVIIREARGSAGTARYPDDQPSVSQLNAATIARAARARGKRIIVVERERAMALRRDVLGNRPGQAFVVTAAGPGGAESCIAVGTLAPGTILCSFTLDR